MEHKRRIKRILCQKNLLFIERDRAQATILTWRYEKKIRSTGMQFTDHGQASCALPVYFRELAPSGSYGTQTRARTRSAVHSYRPCRSLPDLRFRCVVGKSAGAIMTATRLINEKQVLALIGLSRSTLWRLEQSGQFPSRLQVSTRAVRWNLAEVLEWIESRQRVNHKPVP